jgi:hypothetical protein
VRALVLGCLVLVACGGSATTPNPDLAKVFDLTFNSICGRPGDVGNSLGVGKFCEKITDCSSNTKATLCTTLGSDVSYFCTMTCMEGDAGVGTCGENARCACDNGQCGCFPTACD